MIFYFEMYLAHLNYKMYCVVLHTQSQSNEMMFHKTIIHITLCHSLDYSNQR